jgi:hypothetical protein
LNISFISLARFLSIMMLFKPAIKGLSSTSS